jgi:NTE family protein
MRYGIVLSGGGARGAYQAGSLRALYEVCRDAGNLTPFQTLIGLSAGAINASFLASEIEDLDAATERLCLMWKHLRVHDVLKAGPFSMSKTAFKLIRQLTLGGLSSWLRAERLALLNTTPLAQLLNDRVRFNQIAQNVELGRLHALCVTATDYSTSLGVTFFTGSQEIEPWKRVFRQGIRSTITADHVMASAAIPIFFPPWSVGDRFFGDGCLRNTAPLSPAIHCGASKLIVLGARRWKEVDMTPENNIQPSLGRVLSVLINAILMDGIEVDVERIKIINKAMEMTSAARNGFRQVDVFYSQPSKTLSDIAAAHVDDLPQVLKFLIGGLGSPTESAEILSYLTFVPEYETKLVDMGYEDMMANREKLVLFLSSQ